MTLAWNKNEIGNRCFAPCARPVPLLNFFSGIMVRAMVQKMLPIQFGDWKSGEFCRGVFSPVPPNKFNLTRCGIFRGKILQRKIKTKK